MNAVDEILELYREYGDGAYLGEPVSQLQHALQTADLAASAGAPETLIVAALLHDIGHLLLQRSDNTADRGVDGRHEDLGAKFLEQHFGLTVSEPVRLHVAAKRYLCATKLTYFERLSVASRKSLQLQGGAFTPEEVAEFELRPHYRSAQRLRVWDDAAKEPGKRVAPLAHYREILSRFRASVSDDLRFG